MKRILPPIAAAALVAMPAGAYAAPAFALGYGAPAYTVAASCNLAQPLVFVNVEVHNYRKAPSSPLTLQAIDQTGVLQGTAPLPSVDGDDSVTVVVPMRSPGMNAAAIGGPHTITVSAGGRRSAPLLINVPPALCAPPAPAPTTAPSSVPAPAAAGAPGTRGVLSVGARPRVTLATPTPAPNYVVQKISSRQSAVALTLKLGTPANVRAAGGGPECAAHVGAIGALVCPDMIKSGDLLLVWDWQPGAGPDAIDGYRVYRVDGGRKQLVYTRANQKDLTLVDVAKPSGGYTGTCYAVSAYVASRESDLSPPFCAGGGSAATTARLPRSYMRSTYRQRDNTQFTSPGDEGMIVGFSYSKLVHTLGDDFHNYVYRTAVAFDVSSLRNRRLVAAKLHMTIASSQGAGNNHSCATDVGTGTEFWWQNAGWLEGAFGYGIAPTDTGPEITADVTPIVAAWLRGEPNYGFVLKNSDENLGAFIDKRCETAYTSPSLEITYY
jgi:hypothetical protein